jgi:hypothetical protein
MPSRFWSAFAVVALVPTLAVAGDQWSVVQNEGVTNIDSSGTITHMSGRPGIYGSGRAIWQNRPVARFNRIELTGIGDADVQLGSAPGIAILADDNLLPFFTTEVRGGTLIIGAKGSFRTRTAPRLRITAPNIDALKALGSGDIAVSRVANQRLAITLQGSGDLKLQGRTGDLDLKMYGSGDSDTRALAATSVKLNIYGVGDATVRASDRFDGHVYGQGTVRYLGNPRAVNVSAAGSGRFVPGGGQ